MGAAGWPFVFFRLRYLVFCKVAGWLFVLARGDVARDAGIVVLGDENAVWRRLAGRPRMSWPGRAVLRGLARVLAAARRYPTPGVLRPTTQIQGIRTAW